MDLRALDPEKQKQLNKIFLLMNNLDELLEKRLEQLGLRLNHRVEEELRPRGDQLCPIHNVPLLEVMEPYGKQRYHQCFEPNCTHKEWSN